MKSILKRWTSSPSASQPTPAMAAARAMHFLHQGVVVPDYELLLEHVYRRLLGPGAVAIDVGAHSGRHTAALADVATESGRVFAFEPIPSLAEVLRGRFGAHTFVDVREVALSDHDGTAEFVFHPNAAGESGLIPRASETANRTSELLTVRVDTLDRQLAGLDRLDFMKVDVEGGEIAVLSGGMTLIGANRPFIAVEYGEPSYKPHGHRRASLYTWATEAGYVPGDLFGNLVASKEEWIEVCDCSYWDYVLVPEEKIEFWRACFEQDFIEMKARRPA